MKRTKKVPRSNCASTQKTSKFKKAVKRTVQTMLLGAAIFGAGWCGTVEAQIVATFDNSYTQNERNAVNRAVDYWNDLLPTVNRTIQFNKGASLGIAHSDGKNTITFNPSHNFNTKINTQTENNSRTSYSYEAVAIHELGHAFGITGVAIDGSNIVSPFDEPGKIIWYVPFYNEILNWTPWWENLPTDRSNFDKLIRYNGSEPEESGAVSILTGDYYYNYSNTQGLFTFGGQKTREVLNDGNGSGSEILNLENTKETFQPGSSIYHLNTDWGIMNAYQDANQRPFFSEVELAVLKDIGNDIDLRTHFGRSFYQTHTGVVTNTEGFNSSKTYGIGLHLVAGNNTIVQDANLISNGYAGAGIRIENKGNTVTIVNTASPNDPTSRIVRANGEEGIGVLITHHTGNADSGTTLINRGTIEATGTNGTGVWFNSSAPRFDNSGIIRASSGNNAIYIGSDYLLREINFIGNSFVAGNIISDSVGTFSNGEQFRTWLTFGKSTNTDGSAGTSGDGAFDMTYNGNIGGAGIFDLQTWGGATTLTASTLNFRNGSIGEGNIASTLNLTGNVAFDTLTLGKTATAASILDGKNTGLIKVDAGITNSITVQNLASLDVPTIDNHNTIQNNTLVKTTGFFNDGGDDVSIKNQVGANFLNNTTIEANQALRNLGTFRSNGTITAGTFIENKADATIDKTATLLKSGTYLNNAGTISETAKMETGTYLLNTALIDDTSKMIIGTYIDNAGEIRKTAQANVATDVENKAGGQILDTGTMIVGGKVNNAGLIDTAMLIEATGNVENAAWIQKVVTLYSKTDIDNKTGAFIVDNQTVKADRDVLNDGTIDRFKTLEAGQDIQNTANGYINVEQASTMNAGRDAFNAGAIRANGTVNVTNQMTNQANGILVGAGRITTTAGLVNNGIISAGNEPGFGPEKRIDTLNVVGPYVNNDTGKILVDIDPSHYPSNPFAGLHNDLVNVNGAGTVNGGEVFVTAPSNDKTKNPTPARYVGNTKYTFLDTTAGLTVNKKITANDPVDLLLFDFLADHDTKSYWLDIQREYYYGPFGDTYNQISVGNYIDEIGLDPDPTGDFFGVLVELDKLNAGIGHRAGISNAAKFSLDQMSGAIYGTLGTAAVTNTTIVNNTLFDVLRRDAYNNAKTCNPCDPVADRNAATKRNAWGLGYGMGGHTTPLSVLNLVF